MLNRISFEASSTIEALDQVLAWFEQLRTPDIDQVIWMQCQLALAEGFTNAVRHAHKHLPAETPIILEASLQAQALEFQIWDRGQPFDLTSYLAAKVGTPGAEGYQGGGRGLEILAKIADRLSYRRTADERNCLLFVKQYQVSNNAAPLED